MRALGGRSARRVAPTAAARPEGEPLGLLRLAQHLEAVPELGRQVGLVEVSDPLRGSAAVRLVEGALRLVEGLGAGGFVTGAGMAAGLHHRGLSDQDVEASPAG